MYDGLPGMLCELKKHGVKTAVVSNKPDAAVKKLSCEYFGDQMNYAIGASDGVRCKPYPVSWGFRPREVVIAAGAEKIADNASELKQYILE